MISHTGLANTSQFWPWNIIPIPVLGLSGAKIGHCLLSTYKKWTNTTRKPPKMFYPAVLENSLNPRIKYAKEEIVKHSSEWIRVLSRSTVIYFGSNSTNIWVYT